MLWFFNPNFSGKNKIYTLTKTIILPFQKGDFSEEKTKNER